MTDAMRKALEAARALWNSDRAQLSRENPSWEMPAWSRAHAWRRRPYLNAAIAGLTIDDLRRQDAAAVEQAAQDPRA